MVVNVAKVSYNKESEEMRHKEERLLKFLAEHKHTTPFRHPQLQFRVECPIFVERQLFTHQIGWARNSISGRYVDFSDTYWLPDSLRMQSKNSKQGSEGLVPKEQSDYFISEMKKIVDRSAELYKEMSEYGVAKEQCRIHLPLALETKFIWTGSFHAFVHLCNLRLKPDAQQETRELVSEMLNAVKSIEDEPFKYSLLAFGL
jgi:thymidylate synthase (FAD)